MLEHGAYGLLLDRYYSTEQGIPADQAHRVSRARTKEEKQAVDAVLDEFFTLSGGIWINQRAEEEIAKAQTKIKAAKENGKRGGRPKKNNPGSESETQEKATGFSVGSESETQEKATGFSVGSESETQEKAHQTPDTRHQSPDTSKPPEDTHGISPSRAGAVCVALRAEGMASVNPSHPDLIALLNDGAEIQEFVSAARLARDKGKGFAYVLGIVKGQRADAQRAADEARTKPKQGANHARHDVEEPA